MGFGIKTDFKTGREIDLDKTYKNIIKPVFDSLDFLCFRADDIKHSGVIDIPMYENIIKADFVLADISTLNPNVLYELGVRHAVKKHTTLIIAEKGLEFPFDLNHIVIDSFEHLGKAIDYDEVLRFKDLLTEKIKSLMENPKTDSPIYSVFPNLDTPSFSKKEIIEIIDNITEEKSTIDYIEEAEKERKKGNFLKAIELLNKAKEILPHNEYIIQKLALVTYKSKLPNESTALFNAESILSALNPDKTTDPETLGLSGAINKRLYEHYKDTKYLEKSLEYYNRGYHIKQDYYNGINASFLYTVKSTIDSDKFSAFANFGQGIEIRKNVIKICEKIIKSDTFKSREDKDWIYLTLAEAHIGIGNQELEVNFLEEAKKITEGDFALNSYTEQKNKLIKLIKKFNKKHN